MTKSTTRKPKPKNLLINVDRSFTPSITVLTLATKQDGAVLMVAPSKKEPECFEINTGTARLVANRGQLQYFAENLLDLADMPSFSTRERALLEDVIHKTVSRVMLHVALKKTFEVTDKVRAEITKAVLREMESVRWDQHKARERAHGKE